MADGIPNSPDKPELTIVKTVILPASTLSKVDQTQKLDVKTAALPPSGDLVEEKTQDVEMKPNETGAVDSLKEKDEKKKVSAGEDGKKETPPKKTKGTKKEKQSPKKKNEKGSDRNEKASPKKEKVKEKEAQGGKGSDKNEKASPKKEKDKEKEKEKDGSPKQKEFKSPKGGKKGKDSATVDEESKEKAKGRKKPSAQVQMRRRASAERVPVQMRRRASLERLEKKDAPPSTSVCMPQHASSAEAVRPLLRMKPPVDATPSKEKVKPSLPGKPSPDKKADRKPDKSPTAGVQPSPRRTMRRMNSTGKAGASQEDPPSPPRGKKEPHVRRAPSKTKMFLNKIRPGRSRPSWGAGRAGAKATKKKSERKTGPVIPAKEFFYPAKVVVRVADDWDHLDVVFSYGMVVRSIGKSSPLLDYLIVGDQLIGIGTATSENNTIPFEPKNVEEALRQAKGGQVTLTVVRPVGMTHCARKEIPKRKEDCLYFVIELAHNFKAADLSLGCMNGKAIVSKAEGAVSNVLMKDDRILEFDGQSTVKGNRQEALDQMVEQAQTRKTSSKEQPLTCLVERAVEHRLGSGFNTFNAGLTASVTAKKQPTSNMGDDAREIGAREACRIRHWKNFEITVQPILSSTRKVATEKNEGTIEEGGKKKKKAKKGSKRESQNNSPERRTKCRSVTCAKKEKKETSTTPSDVEDVTALQRVTPESGLVKWRNFFGIN